MVAGLEVARIVTEFDECILRNKLISVTISHHELEKKNDHMVLNIMDYLCWRCS